MNLKIDKGCNNIMSFINRAQVQAQSDISTMMNDLYGEKNARAIHNRYQKLSPRLNQLIQKVVYDGFWRRSGLTLIEKSLITIISLIALNKEEQLQMHLISFLHLGGTSAEMRRVLDYMKTSGYISSVNQVDFFLQRAEREMSSKTKFTDLDDSILSARDKGMIDFSVRIAFGNQEITKKCMDNLLSNKVLSRQEIENIMLHQIMYCGFPCAMNGFAVLIDSDKHGKSANQALPQKSQMMDVLYGEAVSKTVYNRCHELSPDFNKLVQEIVYDVFWRRPGIVLIQKSLVTIIALITLTKEEQLRIHLGGFFNLGGTPDMILKILNYMKENGYIVSIDKASSILQDVAKERQLEIKTIGSKALSEREKSIVDLSACVAIGDKEKTEKSMRNALSNKISRAEIENMMLHEMMYCGLPCAMDGFSGLNHVLGQA